MYLVIASNLKGAVLLLLPGVAPSAGARRSVSTNFSLERIPKRENYIVGVEVLAADRCKAGRVRNGPWAVPVVSPGGFERVLATTRLQGKCVRQKSTQRFAIETGVNTYL